MVSRVMSIRDIEYLVKGYTMFDISLGILGTVNIFTLLIGLVIVFALYWLYQATR